MMPKEIKVKLGASKSQKWQRLLLYIQNTPGVVFTMEFDDYEEARCVMMRLYRSIAYNPTWYNLTIIQRKGTLYIIKPDMAQKVVIVDG
jgi:hypothetical protein